MRRIHTFLVCAAVLASGCSRTPAPDSAQRGGDAGATARPAASHDTAPGSTTLRSQPLGEFEPMTQADVDLYLKVMRTAAERLAHLSASDREALKAYRKMNRSGGSAQPTGPADVFAMQRAIGLVQMDGAVADEMGVRGRYDSIAARVQEVAGPIASGDAAAPSAEQQQRMRATDARYQQLRAEDAAVLQPHLAEIQALHREVNLIAHPESLPE